jgi:hypothetical protein
MVNYPWEDRVDAEAEVGSAFADLRQGTREAFPVPQVDEVFVAARSRTIRRQTVAMVSTAAAVLVVLATGAALVRAEPFPTPVATPSSSPEHVAPPSGRPSPGPVVGAPMTRPTGLHLLVQAWHLDIDAGQNHSVAVTGWLERPGAEPLLAEWEWHGDRLRPLEVGTRVEPELPGAPLVVRLNRDPHGTVAASTNGDGLWVLEQEQDACTLREVDLAGVPRSTPRPVPCETRLIGATPHGQWVADGGGVRLLDPETFEVRAHFGDGALVDDHRVVVTDDRWRTIELRNLHTGHLAQVEAPPAYGSTPQVGPVSPDGRWLPFTYGVPGEMPQVMDLWLLDLQTARWLHAPAMPAHTSLKATSLAWAPDGRLVLLGAFPTEWLLVTWRPGEPELAVLPYERPLLGGDEPHSQAVLVIGSR